MTLALGVRDIAQKSMVNMHRAVALIPSTTKQVSKRTLSLTTVCGILLL